MQYTDIFFFFQTKTKFNKKVIYSLAFVAGLKRATDEGSLPEIAQYSPYYLPLNVFTASKGSNLYILFIGKIDFCVFLLHCGYTLEPLSGGSKEYPQCMFWIKNKKIRYTPANPSFSI